MTAFNRWRAEGGNIAADTDMAGLSAWIDNFCQRNPLDTISDAAEALLVELMRRSSGGAARTDPRSESVLPLTTRKQIYDRVGHESEPAYLPAYPPPASPPKVE